MTDLPDDVDEGIKQAAQSLRDAGIPDSEVADDLRSLARSIDPDGERPQATAYWVVNSVHGYGRAMSEYQALANWANAARRDMGDVEAVSVEIAKVRGRNVLRPGRLRAEAIESYAVWTLFPDDIATLAEVADGVDLAAEDALLNGEEVDDPDRPDDLRPSELD
jgi:hypothetical protein